MIIIIKYNIEYLEEIEGVKDLFNKQARNALHGYFNITLAIFNELHTVVCFCLDTSAILVVEGLVRNATVKYDWIEYIVDVIVLESDKTIIKSLKKYLL
jgi:hypothetical protein